MGRKRIYENATDRQRAYQRRKRKVLITPDEVQQTRRKNFKEKYRLALETAKKEKILKAIDIMIINEWLDGKTYNDLARIYNVSKQYIGQKLNLIQDKLQKIVDTSDEIN